MARDEKVIILGAGLAGLAAAYKMKSGYRIVDRQSEPGGLCTTSEDRGYRFDKTGHLLHLKDPSIRKTILSLLDEKPLEIQRKSRIFSSGVYTNYPFQANTHGLPKAVVAECLTGFIKASTSGGNKKKDDSFLDYIYRHFGEGIAKHFMIPYNTKLWGVHPKMITSAWCTRFVPLPTVEEVVAGAIGTPQKQMGYNAKFLYPKKGIGQLPLAMARKVPNIEFGSAPKAIDTKRRRVQFGSQWVPFRALISTVPLNTLLKLLVGAPKWVTGAESKLKCSSLRYLDVALAGKVGNDYHWTYVPEMKYPFYRVGCYSNFSSKMAPRGKSNLYVELSSRRSQTLSKLLPKVADGLTEMGIIKGLDQIEFANPGHLKNAYVIYDHDREIVVPKLLDWLEKHGILCAGRYARWEYSSMEDAISQGFDSASKAKELM